MTSKPRHNLPWVVCDPNQQSNRLVSLLSAVLLRYPDPRFVSPIYAALPFDLSSRPNSITSTNIDLDLSSKVNSILLIQCEGEDTESLALRCFQHALSQSVAIKVKQVILPRQDNNNAVDSKNQNQRVLASAISDSESLGSVVLVAFRSAVDTLSGTLNDILLDLDAASMTSSAEAVKGVILIDSSTRDSLFLYNEKHASSMPVLNVTTTSSTYNLQKLYRNDPYTIHVHFAFGWTRSQRWTRALWLVRLILKFVRATSLVNVETDDQSASRDLMISPHSRL
jgi:hypothetical protein